MPPESADATADRTPAQQAPRSTTPATGSGPTTQLPPKISAALGRYRIAAFVVGVGLLILCLTMVLKYVFDVPQAVAVWGPIHGVLYIAYVLLAFDLAYKDRWSAKGTILVLLAGVVPVLSFYAEHVVTQRVRSRQKV